MTKTEETILWGGLFLGLAIAGVVAYNKLLKRVPVAQSNMPPPNPNGTPSGNGNNTGTGNGTVSGGFKEGLNQNYVTDVLKGGAPIDDWLKHF